MNSFFNGTLRVTLLRVVLALCIVLSVLPPTDMVYGQADDGGSTIYMPIVQGDDSKAAVQETSVSYGDLAIEHLHEMNVHGAMENNNAYQLFFPLIQNHQDAVKRNSSHTDGTSDLIIDLAGYSVPETLVESLTKLLKDRTDLGTEFAIGYFDQPEYDWASATLMLLNRNGCEVPETRTLVDCAVSILAQQKTTLWVAGIEDSDTYVELVRSSPDSVMSPQSRALLSADSQTVKAASANTFNSGGTQEHLFPWDYGEYRIVTQFPNSEHRPNNSMDFVIPASGNSSWAGLLTQEGTITHICVDQTSANVQASITVRHSDNTVSSYLHLDRSAVQNSGLTQNAYIYRGRKLPNLHSHSSFHGQDTSICPMAGTATHLHWTLPVAYGTDFKLEGWTVSENEANNSAGIKKIPGDYIGPSSNYRHTGPGSFSFVQGQVRRGTSAGNTSASGTYTIGITTTGTNGSVRYFATKTNEFGRYAYHPLPLNLEKIQVWAYRDEEYGVATLEDDIQPFYPVSTNNNSVDPVIADNVWCPDSVQAAAIRTVTTSSTCEIPTLPPNIPPPSQPSSGISDLVEILNIGSNKNYKFIPCEDAGKPYIDRDTIFTEQDDSDYQDRWCLQTANDDKNDGSDDLIRLRLKKNAQVRVLIDRRTTDTAAWMDGVFENAESEMDVSGEMGSFAIYDCNSKPGEIVLGGPKYQGGDGSKSMYIVQIREGGNGDKLCTGNFGSTSSADDASDLVELQSVGTGKDYQIVKCAFEEDVYIDRDIVFTEGKNDSNPNDNSDYKDRWCLQTANDDKDDDSDNLVVLNLKKNAQVRVLIDRRTTKVAAWMNGVFGAPVGVMDVSNDDMGHFDIYECYSKPGTLTFGGPKYQGGDGGRGTYIVQIREGGSGDKLCTGNFGSTGSADDASDLVELQSVGTGKDYQIVKCAYEEDVYIDRDIVFTEGKNDSNPNDNSDYKDRWCLQTANDDKDDDSNNLVVLDLKKNAQVRVLIDRRTTKVAAWMNGIFGAPVGVMDVSNDDMGHFDIYECYSKPGTLTFGGPKYQGGDGGRGTYIVQIREGGSGDKLCTGNVSVANNPPILDGELWELEGDSPHPWVNSTLEFVPLKTKHTTDNGNGWRHEYKIKEEHRVAMTEIYEEFQATIRVDMSDGGKTIVAQHHASDTGTIMKLYVADSEESGFDDSVPANGIFDVYVRLRNTDGSEEKEPLGTIRSGDSFTFRVVNKYGVVRVEAFDRLFELEVEDDSASYLKFGNYLQSQDPYDISDDGDCGTPGDSDSFEPCYEDFNITEAKVTMTNVSYTRSTEPGQDFPTPLFTPITTPSPTPSPTLTPTPTPSPAPTLTPTPTPPTVQSTGWIQVPGPASDISVGCDNNVWKLGMGGAIFRYTGGNGATNSWVQVPGSLRNISVACDGEVWGVNSQNKIYRYRPSDNGWTNIQGSLRNISVGCGQVWGVNTSSKVYSRPLNAGWSYQGWGNARELTTDCDGDVWGVQLSQYVHRWQGQAAGAYGYKNMKQIDAGCNDKAAGIDNDGRLYLWVNGGWLSTEYTGILRVSLGCDDNIWMIDTENRVHRSTFNQLYQVVPAASPFSYIEASSNFVTSTTAKAVDGGTNGNWNQGNGSVFASNDANQPWWYGELDEYRYIDTVTIYNRTECCTDRMNNTVLFVSDVPFISTDFQETQSQYGVKAYPITGVQNTYTINVGALGRYVRLQHSGNEYLNFAEIQVNSRSLKQLSGFESVDASGVYAGATTAYRAADGNTNGDWHAEGSVFHSGDTKNPWWFGDLGSSRYVNEIVVHNRTDCCSARADGLYVFVSDNPFTSKNFQDTLAQPGVMSYQLQGTAAQYTVPVNRSGRYVRVQESGTDYMNIAEVVVR